MASIPADRVRCTARCGRTKLCQVSTALRARTAVSRAASRTRAAGRHAAGNQANTSSVVEPRVAIFTWILSWNELLDALVLTSGATETLPVFLSKFASNTLTAYQQMAAVATVQILPAVIITFFAQRYIVAGLSLGALSGE